MPFGWEKVERDSAEYEACVAATSVVGVGAGGITGGAGAALTAGLSVPVLMAAGGALGYVAGYLACPYLAPAVKKKLMAGERITHNEAKNAIEAMHLYGNFTNEQQTLTTFAGLRQMLATGNQSAPTPQSQANLVGPQVERSAAS